MAAIQVFACSDIMPTQLSLKSTITFFLLCDFLLSWSLDKCFANTVHSLADLPETVCWPSWSCCKLVNETEWILSRLGRNSEFSEGERDERCLKEDH